MLSTEGGSRESFAGPADRNESFHCWDKPIYCAADGEVVTVVDDAPDHFGRTGNKANESNRNSLIQVRHARDRYSSYFHVRQGGARVKVGQTVKAGDLLGRVGNAGSSTEPHLHFHYQTLDPSTGLLRNVPVRFDKFWTADGRELSGVPKGDRSEYFTSQVR